MINFQPWQVKRLTHMYYQQQAKSQYSHRDLKSSGQSRESTNLETS